MNRAGPEGLSPPRGPFQLPTLPCSGPRKKLKIVSSYIKKETNRFPAKRLVGEERTVGKVGSGQGEDCKIVSSFKKCLVSLF